MLPEPNYCPRCGVSFQGAPIPEEDRASFGGQTHFTRVIGIYDVVVDRTTAWRCPDCGHTWSEYDQTCQDADG
jgi:predicted RNA-binding Zn-ribbon protein involved in translation (DUF1610 family)